MFLAPEQFFLSRSFECPLSTPLSSLIPHPLSCSLPFPLSRTHRANRDASDDIDGENEDDYSFDR